jgi:hypothetical protein
MPVTISDIIDRLRCEHARLGITLNPAATEAELLAFEQRKGVRLPADMRAFYQCCNGFDVNSDLFRFMPLAENLDDGWNHLLMSPHDFFVAEYMIYADAWALAIDASAPTGYIIYNALEDLTLTTSFAEFLEVAIQHGVHGNAGLYDWAKRLAPPVNPLPTLPNPVAVPTLPPPRRPWYKFW